jgi:hypothetical protein
MKRPVASIVVVLGGLAMLTSASLARANSLDYGCSGSTGPIPCAGKVVDTSDTAFSSTGIKVFEAGDPIPGPENGDRFTLTFNTAGTGPIKLVDFVETSVVLTGTITSFSETDIGTLSELTLTAAFTGLPAEYEAYLGTGPISISTDIFLNSTGVVTNSSTTIDSAPEASTLGLLSLVLLGGLLSIKGKRVLA